MGKRVEYQALNLAKHISYGYASQLTSFAVLAVSNVALPNLLGIGDFSALNSALALIGMTCIIFNEAVALSVVRSVSVLPARGRGKQWSIGVQAAFEHFLLAAMAFLFAILVTKPLARQLTFIEIALGVFTILLIATYVPFVAVLTGQLRNQVVVKLATIQGLGSVIYPLIFQSLDIDVRLSITFTYGTALLFIVLTFRPELLVLDNLPSWSNRMVFRKQFIFLTSPAVLRIAIIWLPVLLFFLENNNDMASSYKIAISLVVGAIGLLPYPKLTMLSVVERGGAALENKYGKAAVFLAGVSVVGGLLMLGPFVEMLYSKEFANLQRILELLVLFVLLGVTIEVAIVAYISAAQGGMLAIGASLSVVAAAGIARVVGFQYFALIAGAVFLAIAASNRLVRSRIPAKFIISTFIVVGATVVAIRSLPSHQVLYAYPVFCCVVALLALRDRDVIPTILGLLRFSK